MSVILLTDDGTYLLSEIHKYITKLSGELGAHVMPIKE